MKLLTKKLREQLLANGARRPPDPKPLLKLSNPCGAATWLFTELDAAAERHRSRLTAPLSLSTPRPGPLRSRAFSRPCSEAAAMPDIQIEAPPAPAAQTPMHPMDPARGENLSPKFAALLAWAIGREPMTEPAITGVVATSECVYASTTHDPFFNALLGSWSDVQANIRGWGAACGAESAVIDGLVDKVRRASQ